MCQNELPKQRVPNNRSEPAVSARPASQIAQAPSADAPPAPADTAPAAASRFPEFKGRDPAAVWPAYFEKNHPPLDEVRKLVTRLHLATEYEHVISVIQSAILNGQAQPWMYEILAMEMEVQKRPKEEIERVALSLTDFGSADYGSMMYSGAYLAGFGRRDAALRLFRQASSMAPEQPEPYIMALPHLKEATRFEDQLWGIPGAIEHVWTRDYSTTQQSGRDVGKDVARKLEAAGKKEQAAELSQAIREANRRDLRVVARWSGDADLDLRIEEPGGGVCSFEQRYSTGGGIFLHDGFGKEAKNAFEEYVCPKGISGTYRISVRLRSGQVTGNRVELEVTTHEGAGEAAGEKKVNKFLALEGGQATWTVKLEKGRRTALRTVPAGAMSLLGPAPAPARGAAKPRVAAAGGRKDGLVVAAGQGGVLRQVPFVGGGNVVPAGGVVGFQPVIQIVPEGTQLYARAAISPDRRYVRIAVNPVFSTITSVFNFTFAGGAGSVQQPAQAGR